MLNQNDYRPFMTESGDQYWIRNDIYENERRKYYDSVATDWIYAMKCEEGRVDGWVWNESWNG